MLPCLDSGQYEAILESLPVGIYVVDRERRILFWNSGAEQMTGYLRHEVMGRSCFNDMLMHCDEENNVLCGSQCPLLGTMKDGKSRDSSIYLRHKDGQRIPVRVRAVPIRDEHGHIVGAAETFDEVKPNLDLRVHPHADAARQRLDPASAVCDIDSVRRYIAASLEDFGEDGISFGVLSASIEKLSEFRALHGAAAADKAMAVVGATLANNLRDDDLVGRGDDDQFVLVIPGCTSVMLERVALKLTRLAAAATVRWWGNSLAVTLAAAGSVATSGDTVESLLKRSRRALHQMVEVARVSNHTGLGKDKCSQSLES